MNLSLKKDIFRSDEMIKIPQYFVYYGIFS